MPSPRTTSFVTLIALAAAAAAMPFPAAASHGPSDQKDSLIAVFDGRYVAGGRTFDSLDALEAAVRSARPGSLRVVACTPTAQQSWLAAVPRFEDFPLHLDVVSEASPLCPTVPLQAAAVAPAQPDRGVQQYWAARMP